MIYDAYITMAVPAPMTETAKRLSQAFDPDVGGYLAFEREATDATGKTYSVYGTPCEASFAAAIAYLQSDPQALLDSTARDYATRWPDDPLPTLTEVTDFCSKLYVSYAQGIRAGCAEFGLIPIET